MTKRSAYIGFMVIILAVFTALGPARAEEEREKPERGFVAAMIYPGVTLGADEKVRVDLKVKNIGRSDETIFLEVTEKPEGWKAEIKGYGKIVSGVFLAEEDDRTMTFSAEPEADSDRLPPGTYKFKVLAKTRDGAYTQETDLTVEVVAKEKAAEGIKLATSYPVLRGPSDAKFEFSLDVNNDSEEDSLFNLSAVMPEGWDVSFKPAYEQKQISSLQIKANQSKSVGVEVTPPPQAPTGEHPFKVKVQSGSASAEVDLMVFLTGTYKIKAGTVTGLLSTATQPGQEAIISLYIRNEGSAPQRQVSFLSFKPENWKVEFSPENVDEIKPGEFKQVDVKIIPAKDALVGDYSVAVQTKGDKANDDVEFRITVKASSAWGWIGVAIILLVIIGLAFTFKFLGRR